MGLYYMQEWGNTDKTTKWVWNQSIFYNSLIKKEPFGNFLPTTGAEKSRFIWKGGYRPLHLYWKSVSGLAARVQCLCWNSTCEFSASNHRYLAASIWQSACLMVLWMTLKGGEKPCSHADLMCVTQHINASQFNPDEAAMCSVMTLPYVVSKGVTI